MRFEPRLIPAEPAPTTLSGDIDLPDDLRQLAARLQDDALFLAERFPAHDPFPAVQPSRRNARATRWRVLSSAAAVIAVLSAGIATLIPWNASIEKQRRQTASGSIRGDLPGIALPARPQRGMVSLDEPAVAPLQVLSSVTGPEREGLLDLLEVDTDSGAGVSF